MTTELPATLRLLDAGDAGLVVEVGAAINEALNRKVIALAAAIEGLALPGVREVVPTYRSLLILFDPLTLSRMDLREQVLAQWPPADAASERSGFWRVPVLYGGEYGVDLEHLASHHGLSKEEVVSL